MDDKTEDRLRSAARRSMDRIFEGLGLGSAREEWIAAYALWRETHREYLEIMATAHVEAAMNGPYTHKYKGVAVTKDQFVRLMNAEGFTWPQDAEYEEAPICLSPEDIAKAQRAKNAAMRAMMDNLPPQDVDA